MLRAHSLSRALLSYKRPPGVTAAALFPPRLKPFVCVTKNLVLPTTSQSCNFHVTSPAKIHPLVIALIKPASRLAAFLFGRHFRIWYQKLSDEEKRNFTNRAKKNVHILAGLGLGISALIAYLYVSHLQTCPVTKRTRFIALKPDQVEKLSAIEFQELMTAYDAQLVAETHPIYNRVARVANKILQSNKDIEALHGKDWTITVIEDETKNAFVLPTGNIFVFTGMLEVCSNDDQLGVVLSHEMAHCVLGHIAEKLSYVNMLSFVVLIPLALIWAILPTDGIAVVTDFFFKRVIDVMLELPFSRHMETEADEIGLVMAAKG